jgi:hypothetical protein
VLNTHTYTNRDIGVTQVVEHLLTKPRVLAQYCKKKKKRRRKKINTFMKGVKINSTTIKFS